jgi:hypothetical protein
MTMGESGFPRNTPLFHRKDTLWEGGFEYRRFSAGLVNCLATRPVCKVGITHGSYGVDPCGDKNASPE